MKGVKADLKRAGGNVRLGSGFGLALAALLAVAAWASDPKAPPAAHPDTTAGKPVPSGEAGKPSSGAAVEEIAAVVGDTPILRSEVEQEAQLAAEQLQIATGDTAAYRKLHRDVLDRMVENQLLLLEAKGQNLKVEEDEVAKAVEQQIQNTIRQSGGPAAFQDQLKKQGMTEQELRTRYREEARKQILANKLIQKEVKPQITVSDSTVRRFYEENRSQLPKKPRALRIQDLFIRTRPDSVVEGRTLQRAEEVRGKILGGLSFADAAAQNSDDPRGKEGGSLGRVARGDLDPDMEAAALSLPQGQVSQPVRSRFGYHLFLVTDKDPQGEWVELSHILFAITPSHSDEVEAQTRAQKIKEQVLAGTLDFTEAIRRFSDDANSKKQDGDMGWIPIDNFYGEMKAVADTLRVGRMAGPVAGDGGYHVFKILGEQAEGNYSFEEIQDQMKQLALQQELEKQLQSYVDKLRKKYYVEVRTDW